MTPNATRVSVSIVLFAIALVLGSLAARSVFGIHREVFSNSPRANELIIDGIGIAASFTAAAAAFAAYPLRERIWVRVYLTLVLLFALAYAFEFILGFLWFAADKFKPFGSTH